MIRGLVGKLGAATLAALGTMGAVTAAPREALAVVLPAAPTASDIHSTATPVKELAHLCLMAELMREWFNANEDRIAVKCPEFKGDLEDFMVEMHTSARVVAKSAGVTLDTKYIETYAQLVRVAREAV